ncbi:MAG: Bax inhibitor-1 family protein [Planctomycetaceae bacterium]|jgi:FtsH-binding integral membrane protein|nr:Bax inhibitor-1 family protein [Planctomycetaceae bacterium]
MQNSQSFDSDFYAPTDLFAAAAAADERTAFITKTYLYLFGAIAALIAIETLLFTALGMETMMGVTQTMLGGKFSWLIVIGAFMVVSWVANAWAMNATSSTMQHAGLGLYVVAMSVILIPLLCLAQLATGDTRLIVSAATATGGLFAMLTAAVFITRKDFSFLRSFLTFGMLAAVGFIATAILFGFALGPIFMYAMIALMCGYILYDTSNVLHHYRIGQHVAASLALFASVVLLFWYILQLFLSRE